MFELYEMVHYLSQGHGPLMTKMNSGPCVVVPNMIFLHSRNVMSAVCVLDVYCSLILYCYNWRYVTLVVVLWHPALSSLASVATIR